MKSFIARQDRLSFFFIVVFYFILRRKLQKPATYLHTVPFTVSALYSYLINDLSPHDMICSDFSIFKTEGMLWRNGPKQIIK